MECATGDDGVHTFTKTVEVEPQAKYQYKFRVGEGDWWILNEDAPTGRTTWNYSSRQSG